MHELDSESTGYIYILNMGPEYFNIIVSRKKIFYPNRMFTVCVNSYDDVKKNIADMLEKYMKKSKLYHNMTFNDLKNIILKNYKYIESVNFKQNSNGGYNIPKHHLRYYLDINSNKQVIIDMSGGSKDKIMVEYYRYLVVQKIIKLERNHKFIICLETYIINSINNKLRKENISVLEKDPVFGFDIDNDETVEMFSAYMYGKKISEVDKQNVRNLVKRIAEMVNTFLNMKQYPLLPYGYENEYYYCGSFRKKLIPEVREALLWRLTQNGYTDPLVQTEIILTSLLRYESIVNLYKQWTIPYNFYEYLVKIGYNCEGMSSPFNSQMIVVDYNNKTNNSKFCSLFPDIDKPFGCIGNFFQTDLSNYKTVVVSSLNPHEVHKFIKEKSLKDIMVVSVFDHEIIGDETVIILTNEYYFENKTLANTVVNYKWGAKLSLHVFDKAKCAKPLILDLSGLKENDDMSGKRLKYEKKLAIEWTRYLHVQQIVSIKIDERKRYEYLNIVERLLLSMANLPKDSYGDAIFKKLDINHKYYVKCVEELEAKRIDKNTVHEIKKIIDEFLENKIRENLQLPASHGYTGFGRYYCGSYERVIDNNRNMLLIKKLNDKHVKHFIILILICMLRYECILSLGQHWNFPFVWYEYLYNRYNLRFEGFASPFNSQLLMAEKDIENGSINYCSLFYDTDKYFGSLGNLFKLDISKLPRINNQLVLAVNPPYVMEIIDNMLLLFDKWLLDKNVTIFTGVPGWHDADFVKNLDNHKFLLYKKEFSGGDYYYEISNNPVVPRVKPRSSLITYILSNRTTDMIDTKQFEKISEKYNKVKYLDS